MKNEYIHSLSEVVGGIIWDGKGLDLDLEEDILSNAAGELSSDIEFDSEKASEVDFDRVVSGEDLC